MSACHCTSVGKALSREEGLQFLSHICRPCGVAPTNKDRLSGAKLASDLLHDLLSHVEVLRSNIDSICYDIVAMPAMGLGYLP